MRDRSAAAPRVVTGRALVLGTLVVLLIVVLASPVNRYFSSRGDVGKASSQLRQDQQQLATLKQQLADWSDPGYVQQQARARLQYAMPGDTVFVVVKQGQQTQIQASDAIARAAAHAAGPTWNQRLWRSVTVAGAAK
jgi:cell division protein FtsB